MAYILILVLGSNGINFTVSQQEYSSLQNCEAAIEKIKFARPDLNEKGPRWIADRAFCVEK